MVRQQNEVIKFLVATGADINTVDFDGVSPLHLACALILSSGHSNLETVRLLVALKADPNRLTFAKGKRNCLQQCCLNGNLDLIKLLVESANADVTLTDEEGDDAIQFAIGTKIEYSEVLKVLLRSPAANPFSGNKRLRTSLHRAASKGFLASISMILAHSACTEDRVNM